MEKKGIIEHSTLQFFSSSLNATLRKQEPSLFLTIYSFTQALLKFGDGRCIRSIMNIRWKFENIILSNLPICCVFFLYCFIVFCVINLYFVSSKDLSTSSICVIQLQVFYPSFLLPPLTLIYHLCTLSNHRYSQYTPIIPPPSSPPQIFCYNCHGIFKSKQFC